jgi:peptidoglycan/LPS O-acetylase OafA/YrhL
MMICSPKSPVFGHPQRDEGRILGFDGLRGIAFMLVFASHKVPLPHRDSYGDVGVYLFFVLSGFLITRILAAGREGIEKGVWSFRNALVQFYARRTARIFPIYYTVLLFWTAISFFVVVPSFAGAERFANFLYLTNILIAHRNAWIGDFGHLWTLAIEEQFYLLFAPIVLLVPRARTWVACGMFLALGITTKVFLEISHAAPISIDVNSFVNFALLALGGLVGLNVDRLSPRRWLCDGSAQALMLTLFVCLPFAMGGHPAWSLGAKFAGLVAAVLLFQIYHRQRSWFVRLLDKPPLRFVGRVSYGAYLFHPFIHLPVVRDLLMAWGVGQIAADASRVGVELGATLALAAISWLALERPIIHWTRRRF